MDIRNGRTAVAAVLALASAGVAQAQPARRAGLWEMRMTGGPMAGPSGGMAMTIRSCVDPAAERPGAAMTPHPPAASGMTCTGGPAGPAPNGGFAFHQVCRSRGMTIDTQGVASGDFRTAYTVKTTTRMTPAPIPAMAVSQTTMNGRYLGACPAGMKPGETTVNGRAMPSMRPHAPG